MEEQKAFRVEVGIGAPPERVWTALTDPVEIRRWHGWDAEGLDAEIEYIYVSHATRTPRHRIELDDGDRGQVIELLPGDGAATIVRVSRPGSRPADESYDEIEEGWRSFLQQMRHYLERHDGEERRTIFLNGKAAASELASALRDKLPGRPWFEDTFQRGITTGDYGGGLVVLAAREPLASDEPGAVHITLTTHGLDDREFAAVRDDWWTWWRSKVVAPEVVTR